MHKWQLHEAKNKLSSLVETALHGKAQVITKRGQEAVVVISIEEYLKLKNKKLSFKEFLLSAPKIDGLELDRAVSRAREVDL